MAAIICQEHSQALQGLPIDLTSERLLSGQHLLVHSLGEEAIAGASDACLELPRLTVCQPTGMEWKPVECSARDCNDSLEQCGVNFMSVAEANHDINAVPIFLLHDAPLYASTPDVHQTSDCVNDHLSNQVTIYAEPKTKRHRSSSHAHTCQLMSKSQAGFNHTRSKSLNPESPLHKRIVCDFEKDLTFRPRLNEYSLKLASKSTRNSVPVVHRLLEARKNVPDPSDHRLTFAPKLNPVSLKMAQERAAKMPEVQARLAEQAMARRAEALSEYTFKPRVSVRSLRIAQSLGTSFLSRQKMYLEKRQKTIDEAYKPPPVSKRLVKSNHRVPPLPNSPSPKKLASESTNSDNTVHTAATTATRPTRLSFTAPSPVSSTSPSEECRSKSSTPQETISPGPVDSTPTKSTKPLRKVKRSKSSPQHPGGEVPGEHEALKRAKFSALCDVDRVKRVKTKSERTVKAKKVFLIMDGAYRTIRHGLRKRGWVEQAYRKATTSKKTALKPEGGMASDNSDCDEFEEEEEVYSDEEEYSMMSRAVRNAVPNFVWSLKRYDPVHHHLNKDSLVNHFVKASSFTTKVGLCSNLRQLVWFGDTDHHSFFPRCYKLSCDEEKDTFIDDYRMTAALCILKMISTQYTTSEEGKPLSLTLDQPSLAMIAPHRSSTAGSGVSRTVTTLDPRLVLSGEGLALATRAARVYISSKRHDDIERSQTLLHPKLTETEWCLLIKYFYKMVFERGVVKIMDCSSISEANDLLDEIEKYCPQLYMDGSRNIWIVKPGALSRGRGIMCMNNLEDILSLVTSSVKREGKWVVQKYIERPLLIYETKFDVRQWFLVTDWNPLTMWIYKDCYMRFCTQTYTLDDMDESVHLCNNSIQRNYTNSTSRAEALPSDNMWDSATFKDYLESIGEGDKWEGIIYPGMRQALVHVLQVTQDEIEHRKCSFELYGADFMITSDYRPWLIEVNSSPAMSLSTSVTARLCTAVLEDTLKVVVDRRDDKDSDTGGFELAYKQVKLDQPSYVGMQLWVQGSSISKPRDHTFIRKTVTTTSKPSVQLHPPTASPNKADTKIEQEQDKTHNLVRLTTPHTTSFTLDFALKTRTPLKSARRRIATRPRPHTESGLRLGESIPNNLSTGERMATRPQPHTESGLLLESIPNNLSTPGERMATRHKPPTESGLLLESIPNNLSTPGERIATRHKPPTETESGLRLEESIPDDLSTAGERMATRPKLRTESGLLLRLGESVLNNLGTPGERMAVSTSTGNVNPVVRFTRKTLPNR